MITVNLKGGLGNQMFQYAAARALANRNQDSLCLVRSSSKNDIGRPFSLTHFKITAEINTPDSVPLWQRIETWFLQKIKRQFYVGFEPAILNLKGDIYLDGYFQSEKYFLDQAETIKKDLELKNPLSPFAAKNLHAIEADDLSVSLHIRRGDYLKHGEFSNIATLDYYKQATEKMRGLIGDNARFYIFSDDIAWCKENLPFINEPVFISSPDLADYEEMFLMSCCKHQIIANSSFSWWSAWLNKNPNKIVIAPRRWSNHHDQDWYHDIIPEKWIRI